MDLKEKSKIIDDAFWGTFYANLSTRMSQVFTSIGVRTTKEKNEKILNEIGMFFRPENMEKYVGGEYTIPNYIYHPIRARIMDVYNVSEQIAESLFGQIMNSGIQEYYTTIDILKGVIFGDYDSEAGIRIQKRELEEGIKPIRYISRSKDLDIRKKISELSEADLYYILVKHAMASFGIQNRPFQISNAAMMKIFESEYYNDVDMAELFSYALLGDPKLIVMHAALHPKAMKALVHEFFYKRYYLGKAKELDAFDGRLSATNSPASAQNFYQNYISLSNTFESLTVTKEDVIGNKPKF